VASSLHGTVSRIPLDGGAVLDELPVERAPVGMCGDETGGRLYVCNRGAGTVSVLDTRAGRETHRVTVGNAPGDCALDPVSGTLLVSNAGSGTVTFVHRPWLPGPTQPAVHPLVGRALPDFALPDLRGGRIRTSREWAEKKYVINFFASW
jgi:YVTN family beta-propeller protein